MLSRDRGEQWMSSKCGLDEWSARWIENWLNGRAQRAVVSSAESGWRPVARGVA